VLLEFILDKKQEGMPLDRALIERGHPDPAIVLTAAAPSSVRVIVTDPVWSASRLRSSSGCWRRPRSPG